MMFRGQLTRRRSAGTKVVVLGLAASAALAGCGSVGKTTQLASVGLPTGVAGPGHESTACIRRGGTLRVLSVADYEHLDPGQAYSLNDYQTILATQRPLFSYRPGDFGQAVPDLASEPARTSSDARTVTIHIRHGVRFSPPVNREVTSADVAYALERGANPHVLNPYIGSYFSSIEGMAQAKGGPITGISTPDRYTIVLHLTEPKAQTVVDALALPLSAPVPEEYAKPYDESKQPGEYGMHQVATGPYMLPANAQHSILGVGYRPGVSATLVRNPNWNAATDSRPACLDRIEIRIGGDPQVLGLQALRGSHTLEIGGAEATVTKLAYEHDRSQLEIWPGAGTKYITVDNAYGPFANENVRKAFWAALNRVALVKSIGGTVVGTVMTHFIPPGMPGFEQAGGLAGPQVDYNAHPEGNLEVARKYMRLAGYKSGRYTGSHVLEVVSVTSASVQIAVVDQALTSLGFKINDVRVSPSVVFSKYCGVPRERVDVCMLAWLPDFQDPYAMLFVPFSGKAIVPVGNYNFGLVNDPEINQAMAAAEQIVGTEARSKAWAKVDEKLVEHAVAIPFDFNKGVFVESHDVAGVGNVLFGGGWDYTYTSLK